MALFSQLAKEEDVGMGRIDGMEHGGWDGWRRGNDSGATSKAE